MNTEIKKSGRKTKEERLVIRQHQVAERLVLTNRFLRDTKYYKNNYWSWAAWDSWAAKGQAGSCQCGCGYYNGTLHNTRKNTDRGGKKSWLREVSPNLCSTCIDLIEKLLNHKFKKL